MDVATSRPNVASVEADRDPEPDPSVVAELLERGQTGHADEVLIEVDTALRGRTGNLADGPAALHFVRCVMLVWTGQPDDVIAASTMAAAAADALDHPGWKACALAVRAQARIRAGERDAAVFDADAVMRDLVGAQIAMDHVVADEIVACHAATNIAIGFDMMRLYELALPYYETAHQLSLKLPVLTGNPALRSVNLAMLHLGWALELYRVGQGPAARRHTEEAGRHAERAATEPSRITDGRWLDVAAVYTACADADGNDPAGAAERLEHGLARLATHSGQSEREIALPFHAIALSGCGRTDEALRVIQTAEAELQDDSEWLTRVAIAFTHARLLERSGSADAAVALRYGDQLAQSMWRERLRTLHAARTLYQFEQLRSETESLSRSLGTDALTGILNRRGLEERLVEHAACPASEMVAVLALDMDCFKQLNDTRGHAAGDAALQRVAQALGAMVRTGDAVARTGGDEFAALLPGAPLEAALGIAERVVAAVAAVEDPPASVSVGVAVGACPELRRTLEAADDAMYVAKRGGGGRVALAAS